MKTLFTIIVLSIFTVSCSPEEPEYDTLTDSPTTQGPEIYYDVFVGDTLYKETFGTFYNAEVNKMIANDFNKQPYPFTYDNQDVEYAGYVAYGELTSPYPIGVNQPDVMRESYLYPDMGYSNNNLLQFKGGEQLQISDIPIGDINTSTKISYKSKDAGVYALIYRSKDGVTYIDTKQIYFKEGSTKGYYETDELGGYLQNFRYLRITLIGPWSSIGTVDDLCVVTNIKKI